MQKQLNMPSHVKFLTKTAAYMASGHTAIELMFAEDHS